MSNFELKMKVALLIFFIYMPFWSFSQNFHWVKRYGSRYNENANAVSMLDDSSVVALFWSGGNDNLSDSFPIGNSSYTVQGDTRIHSYLVSMNPSGIVDTSKYLGNFYNQRMVAGRNGLLYISGRLQDTGKTILDTLQLERNNGELFVACFNKRLELVWLNQFGNGTGRIDNIYFSNGKLLYNASGSGNWVLKQDTLNLGPGRAYFFGELDLTDGSFRWSNFLYRSQTQGESPRIMILSLAYGSSCYYVSCIVSALNIILKNDTIPLSTFSILKVDMKGNYISKHIILKNKSIGNFISGRHAFQIVNDKLIFSAYFKDTFLWNNVKYGPYKKKYSFVYTEFLACIDTFSQEQWFLPMINDSGEYSFSSVSTSLTVQNEFLYLTGIAWEKISFGEYTISDSRWPMSKGFISKIDLSGNVLWLVNQNIHSVEASIKDSSNSIYFCGSFTDTLQLGKNKVVASGKGDAFISKLSDDAIIRGTVSPGPYCAGDTFKVPYKKIGDYDTSNYFIAELSDADGNFTGEHRELGRIKTNKDSVVLGKLPLFQVSSSEKYRIRILSTAPAVQSYYRFDTLRLLIYSKDKANPGGDTLICKGDSLKLQTFGGTKWTWSPKYKMFDSTARETMVWPDKTTTYTIIIADSSGCGQADTAIKTVLVRNELSVQFHTPKDTNVCLNGTMPLIVSFHGGDSTGYNWQWTIIDSKNNYSFPQSGSGKQFDTLLYTLPTNEKDSVRISVYLSDACTPNAAIASYTLKVKKYKTTTTFKENDTTACPGKMLPVVANFKGSSAALLSWQWQEANTFNQWINRKASSNKQADTFNYTLPLNWKGNKRLRVILKDNCSGLNDTAVYTITPRDTLQLALNTNDTTLCKGQTYTYKAIAKDGYSAGYQFVWIDTQTGDTLSTKDSFKLLATENQTIKVTLQDGCMPNAISRTFNVTVHPEITTEIRLNNTNTKANDTVLCYGQSIEYQAQTAGGIGTNYSYSWKLNGTEFSTQNSLEITENDYKQLAGSTIRLQLIISDGCTVVNDSTELNIEILEPISQTTNYPDSICYQSSNNFKTTAQGGTGNYIYKWIDNTNNIISSIDNYNFTHNTNQTGISTIKVIVSDACSENDTAEINTVLLAPLNITIIASDPCPINALTLTANATGGKTTSRQINWFENSSQIGTGNSITINTQGIPKTITAIVTDACSKSDTQSISTGSRPGIKLEANNICLGDETNIVAKSINASKADTYQWKIDGQLQTETDSILKMKFNSIGRYKILVTASNNGTCQGLDSTNLEIIAKPEAAFEFVHFKSQGNLIPFRFLNRSQKESNWYWDFGTGDTSMLQDPNYSYTDTGKFWVQLIVGRQGKCFDTTRQLVPVYNDIAFYFPNVFSPNGNSINETFGLSSGQWFKVSSYTLKIYNRWGELMFSTDQMQEQWTGEGAQQSVYIYIAEIRDVYNVLHKIEGVVELLK